MFRNAGRNIVFDSFIHSLFYREWCMLLFQAVSYFSKIMYNYRQVYTTFFIKTNGVSYIIWQKMHTRMRVYKTLLIKEHVYDSIYTNDIQCHLREPRVLHRLHHRRTIYEHIGPSREKTNIVAFAQSIDRIIISRPCRLTRTDTFRLLWKK